MEQQEQTTLFFRQIQELYGKFGIRSMTMDDIAAQLGISKKTIYQVVRDKTELIDRVIDLDIEWTRDFMNGLDASGANAIEDLNSINDWIYRQRRHLSPTFYYDLRKYYPELYHRWISEKRNQLFQMIDSNIRKGKTEGLYRKELNGEVIASLYISRMERLEPTDPMEDPEALTDDFIREVFIYHLHGICNRKGIDYLEHKLIFQHEKPNK